MRSFCCLSLATCFAAVSPLLADDLGAIERSIRKEPAYQSQKPLYCLLVFGPEAKTPVWLVLDGDVLYLDRNGNGDLTDPGERITPEVVLHRAATRPDVEVMRIFHLSRPKANPWEADSAPILICGPEVTWFYVMQLLPREDWHDREWARYWEEKPFDVAVNLTNDHGQRGRVRFADRPEDAPVLHFAGPRRLAVSDKFGPLEFRRGESSELYLQLVTPGLNAVVKTDHDAIPEGIHPVVEAEYPPSRPGENPIRQRVVLRERC